MKEKKGLTVAPGRTRTGGTPAVNASISLISSTAPKENPEETISCAQA